MNAEDHLAATFRAQFDAFVLPIEQLLGAPEAEVELIPIHLETIQEGFDLILPFAQVLPAETYNAATRSLLSLRSQLEGVQRGAPVVGPHSLWSYTMSGQWQLDIDEDALAELSELRVSDAKIAVLLGCSPTTVKRRRKAAGLSKGRNAMDMDSLCTAIRDVRNMGTGEAGERCMIGALTAIGVSVSRAKIRAAVRLLDPFPVAPRWRTALQRRTYYVPFVNSLWHLDGHHKLIRWRIVIHGCIDGKSRIVTYMRAHSDNTEASVTRCFEEAVNVWGTPSRVRADFGGENVGVKQWMEQRRGLGRGSFIQGSSTHNQRIERLWVDLQRLTTDKYKRVFEHLEAERLLDVSNPIHLWALHFIFLPQLNHALDHFAELWNHHPMRTSGLGNRSPMQLRTEGIVEARGRGIDILRNAVDDEEVLEAGVRDFAAYGVDFAGQGRERNENDPHVHIAAIDDLLPPPLLDPELQTAWRLQLPPSWPPPDDFGILAYCRLLDIVADHLRV
ncbi:hypothetical protein CF326_g7405 [Tilletia indica]|nr:hypothetical protein CF326_g7405 [Tilletia indica]